MRKRIKISIPDDIRSIKHPIIGFVGSLADWLDYDMLCDAAVKNEDLFFVFVEPINTHNLKLKDLQNLKNVYFLGIKKHEEIPAYIVQFDVCLIPFKIQNLTQSALPIKLFEYFSLGKPVVSRKLDELQKFADVIYITENNAFEDQLKMALRENNIDLQKKGNV